ncbi:MAG: hypothetical protein HOE90_00275 [Bacteriovoracaceae bacterium]|jgi:hypothetical protein|nr:hypothetical protein [Bacteriovoracaceae bacterium]
MNSSSLEQACTLAGDIDDFDKRSIELYRIYIDSNKNFLNPLILSYETKQLSKEIYLYELILNSVFFIFRRWQWMLTKYLIPVSLYLREKKQTNRYLFLDLVTKYLESKSENKCNFISTEYQNSLDLIHLYRKKNRKIDSIRKKEIYLSVLKWEETRIVAPRYSITASHLKGAFLKKLFNKMLYRLSFFPWYKFILISDFNVLDDRILQRSKAFDLAGSAGINKLEAPFLNSLQT